MSAEAEAAGRKRVHFAADNQLQYVASTAADDVTGSRGSDVTDDDDVGDGASEMSYTNSDCSSGLYVVNCGSYRVTDSVVGAGSGTMGGAIGDGRPPIVAFRTFLPPDGSLV
jgi:hypothetical protein